MMRSLTVCLTDTPSPGSDPQTAVMVGGKGRHTVMGQAGVGRREMDEVVRPSLTKVQASFHRAYPKPSVGLDIHRIHRIGREGMRIAGMNGVAKEQALWSQAHDATRLGAYPDIAVIDSDAVHKLTFHGNSTLSGPGCKTVCLVVVDIDTP